MQWGLGTVFVQYQGVERKGGCIIYGLVWIMLQRGFRAWSANGVAPLCNRCNTIQQTVKNSRFQPVPNQFFSHHFCWLFGICNWFYFIVNNFYGKSFLIPCLIIKENKRCFGNFFFLLLQYHLSVHLFLVFSALVDWILTRLFSKQTKVSFRFAKFEVLML